jgi:DNA-binding winged helix-turn-helix (wHTH) protein
MSETSPDPISFASDHCSFDYHHRQLIIDDGLQYVSDSEANVLRLLTTNLDRVVRQKTFDQVIWSSNNSRQLIATVGRVRDRFEEGLPGAGDPKTGIIKTIRRVGFLLVSEWLAEDLSTDSGESLT